MRNELYNLSATASKAGVPVKWLKEMSLTGKIPCLKISNSRLLFNIDAVKRTLVELAAKGVANEQ